MKVYDNSGHELTLVEPPLGSGGEGSVYAISGYNRVAKIYAADAVSHRAKIEAMASIYGGIAANPSLKEVAWPLAPLYGDKARKSFVGFGMRRISKSTRLADLYNYNPGMSGTIPMCERIDFLVELAQMVDALHGLGQVIGDFNDNNIPVLAGGHAALVDADSFHVSVGGRLYKCEVCKPGYVAPEVIRNTRGTTYAEATKETFTKETDRFSLAVHIFKMLFNGVHPFHCVSLPDKSGSVPAAIPIEKRVERGETPFFKSVPGVKLPAYAPRLSDFPDYLTSCFRRAFVDGRSNPSARPTASEWAKVLVRYRSDITVTCSHASHAHWKGAKGCPYCEADKRFGKAASAVGVAIVPKPTPKASPWAAVLPCSSGTAAAATIPVKPGIRGRVAAFAAKVRATKAAIVAAVSPKAPGSLRFGSLAPWQYWFATLAGSVVVGSFASHVVASVVFYRMCGWTPTPLMVAPLVVAGAVMTGLFNTYYATSDDGKTIGLSIAASLVGVALVTLLYLFCVYVLPYLLAGALFVLIIIGMLDML